MNRNRCDVSEMQIVDDLLGHLPEDERRALRRHAAACPVCRQRYEEWRQCLQNAQNEPYPSPSATASVATPPLRAYRRLRRRVLLRHVRRKWFRPGHVMGLVSAATAVALIIGMFSLFREQAPSAPLLPPATAENTAWPAEHPPHALFLDARTISLPVSSEHARAAGVYGHVWVNGYTGEMFFRLQGLMHDQDHDYQVWLIKALRRENAGLLHMDGDFAELYTRGQNIREVQTISVSKEPKGGSAAPTAPEMILLDFLPAHNGPQTRPE